MTRFRLTVVRSALVGSILAGLLAASDGCKSGSSAATGSVEVARPTPQPPNPATLGGVRGTVSLAGKAPAPVRIDTSMDPACGVGGGGDLYSEQYAVRNGKLANVYVYVKSGPPAAMQAPAEGPAANAVMDQKGCRYVPHVIAVMAGGAVEFRNSDGTMHNIHTMPTVVGNDTIDVSQGPRGAPQVKKFMQPEVMMPVRCNNHPWMNAFVSVSSTPFFAVSREDGSFELKGMPAGEYTLAAVHEKLGEQDIHVTVPAQATATSEFKFAMK